MKKFLRFIASALLVGAISLSATACNQQIEKGSRIEYLDVTLEYEIDGEATEKTVSFKIYSNFAPATLEHFKYLAAQGYYDGSAISDMTSSYVEFGAYALSGNQLLSKYDAATEKNYYSIITDAYVSGKTIGSGDLARYVADYSIVGEFEKNGFGGNKLDLSLGALVLKRDKGSDGSYYNTGKGTMAITFGSTGYFGAKTDFAILGKLRSDDEVEDDKSSYDFIRSLIEDFDTDADERSYYYYNYVYTEKDLEDEDNATANDKLAAYGRYFMNDNGGYYYKGANGSYNEPLDATDDAKLISAFSSHSENMLSLPSADAKLKIKSVKFA